MLSDHHAIIAPSRGSEANAKHAALRAALKQIGYNDTYHASCIYLENPRDSEMWVDAYRAKYRDQGKKFGKEEFDKLLGHCMVCASVLQALGRRLFTNS